jgi:hypothetical protein
MTEQDDRPDSRVADFRRLAETAKQMATKADTQAEREDYLRMAEEWFRLADEIEKSNDNSANAKA